MRFFSTNFSIWENLQLLPSFKNTHNFHTQKRMHFNINLKCIISCLFSNMCLLPGTIPIKNTKDFSIPPFSEAEGRSDLTGMLITQGQDTALSRAGGRLPMKPPAFSAFAQQQRTCVSPFTDGFIPTRGKRFTEPRIRSSSSLLNWYVYVGNTTYSRHKGTTDFSMHSAFFYPQVFCTFLFLCLENPFPHLLLHLPLTNAYLLRDSR